MFFLWYRTAFILLVGVNFIFPTIVPHAITAVLFIPFVIGYIYDSPNKLQLVGIILMLCGSVLNCVAIVWNEGKMPVDRPERVLKNFSGDINHSVMKPRSKFKMLCDMYSIGFGIMSAGDAFIFVGVPVFFIGVCCVRIKEIRDTRKNR